MSGDVASEVVQTLATDTPATVRTAFLAIALRSADDAFASYAGFVLLAFPAVATATIIAAVLAGAVRNAEAGLFGGADVIREFAFPADTSAAVRSALLAIAGSCAASAVVYANLIICAFTANAAAAIRAAGLVGAVWLADAQPVNAGILRTTAFAAATGAAAVIAALSVVARIRGCATYLSGEADVSFRADIVVHALLYAQRAVGLPNTGTADLARTGKLAIRVAFALDGDVSLMATLRGNICDQVGIDLVCRRIRGVVHDISGKVNYGINRTRSATNAQ